MKGLRNKQIRFLLVPVMALSFLAACGGYELRHMTPEDVIDERPTEVRLTMLDGSTVQLERPHVSGAFVIGQPEKTWYGADPAVVRLPIDSVAHAATRPNNDVAIAVLATLTAVTVMAVVVIRSLLDSYNGPFGGCCH